MPAVALAALLAGLVLLCSIPSSLAQADQSITLNTSKRSYAPGEEVNINGTVVGGQPGQLVAIQIKDSKGSLILIRTVQADQNGRFMLSFKMPPTAPSGSIGITASARISGYVVTQSTGVTAVPEFPSSALVLVAGISVIVAMYRSLGGRSGMLRGRQKE